MSEYCKLSENLVTHYPILTQVYQHACLTVIPFLGIHPVSHSKSFFDFFTDFGKGIFDFSSIAFHIGFFLLTTATAFTLGIYVRRHTIVGLLRQKEAWVDKEKMLLNQLWAALEEKLESKSMLHEAKTTLEKFQVELNGEKSEKQSMQSRMWSLDRNIKNLQAERDMLEKKLKDCISTFNGMRISLEKHCDEGENSKLSTCMEKIKSLQTLMQNLIEAHRKEHKNFVAILEKPPSC